MAGAVGPISVTVASNRSEELLEACLASLLTQCTAHKAELIVVRSGSPDEVARLGKEWPSARFLAAPPESSQKKPPPAS